MCPNEHFIAEMMNCAFIIVMRIFYAAYQVPGAWRCSRLTRDDSDSDLTIPKSPYRGEETKITNSPPGARIWRGTPRYTLCRLWALVRE
jgi:hypothetical protein